MKDIPEGEVCMQRLIIDQLGPINHCDLKVTDFMVFTGAQASGKSTIAKSIFFFNNIRNLLIQLLRRQYLLSESIRNSVLEMSLKNRLIREIRSNFLQIFGSTWGIDNAMRLEYRYKGDIYICLSLKSDSVARNYIRLDLGTDLSDFLEMLEGELFLKGDSQYDRFLMLKGKVEEFFGERSEIVYIPAGRSMITLLGTQLSYVYSSMDDVQKRSMDYCTQNYLERVLQLKEAFSVDPGQMIENLLSTTDIRVDRELLLEAAQLMKEILQGEYRNVSGEERLQISERRYVKINFASSGQQEAVWILNVLFYYLLNNRDSYFIIEEPESHLFPNAQKLIMEFIALAQNRGKNKILITTHSPYILGTINNLLYADKIAETVPEDELREIVPQSRRIIFNALSAFFIQGGSVEECVDKEFGAIKNEVVDSASGDIDEDYDRMVCLKERYRRGENAKNDAYSGEFTL